jgi:hypothetical protein
LPVCHPSVISKQMWAITSCWLVISCLPSISDVKWNVNNQKLLTPDCLFVFHLWWEMKCEQSSVANAWLPVCLPSVISKQMWAITSCWLVIAWLPFISDVKWNVNNQKLLTPDCLFAFHLWCQMKCEQS